MMPRKQRRRLSGFRLRLRSGRRFRNGRPGRCRVGRLRELLYGRRLLRLQRFGQRIGGLDRSRRIGTLRPDGLNRNGVRLRGKHQKLPSPVDQRNRDGRDA